MTTEDDRRLRIAVVAPPWFKLPPGAYGGIEWMCYYLVEGLVDRGHEITLVGVDENLTSAPDFVQSYREAPSARLGEPFPEVAHAAVAGHAIAELEPDVVHDHTLAGPLLAFARECPTIVTAHGPVNGEIGVYYELLSPAVHLVAISEAQRRIAPHLPWLGTVYNAIPVDEYPYREDKEDYLIWLGRMNEEKAPHLAIDVARETGRPIVLAGKCSEPAERAFFEREVEPRLGDGVEWVGEADTERKKELLSSAYCFLFPLQWQEPFGIVMVEALACGTPVVALNEGSVPEIVIDGVTGFVRDDVDELAGAIAKVDDIDKRGCRKFVADNFDIDAMVTGYEHMYRRAADTGPR